MYWVELTETDGQKIYINLSHVVKVEASTRYGKAISVLTLVGASKTLEVEEEPSTLYAWARAAQGSN